MKLKTIFFTAAAVQRDATAAEEDCMFCPITDVVPEMYTPNPVYG